MKTKEQLASHIPEYSRNTVLVRMPFMSRELFLLVFVASADHSFASDGESFFYNADYIIERYSEDVEFLIAQFIRYPEIAEDFWNYYQLYKKYEADYLIDSTIKGTCSKTILQCCRDALFDERYSPISQIMSALSARIRLVNEDEDYIRHLLANLKQVKEGADCNTPALKENTKRERERKMGLLSSSANKKYERVIDFLCSHLNDSFSLIKEEYDRLVEVLKDNTAMIDNILNNIFFFVRDAFGEKEEMTIPVSEMTMNTTCAHFIARHNNALYTHYSDVLSLKERNLQLAAEVKELN